jgi:hypothetical protein
MNASKQHTTRTFTGYINKELETIKEFSGSTSGTTHIRKVLNEGYSTYDFTYQSGNTICIAEVKTRNCYSHTYQDTVLELLKVNNMFNKVCEFKNNHQQLQFKPVFIVKFTDGLFLIDMTTTTTTMSIKACPKHTAGNGDNNYINKTLVHYKLNNATKIN